MMNATHDGFNRFAITSRFDQSQKVSAYDMSGVKQSNHRMLASGGAETGDREDTGFMIPRLNIKQRKHSEVTHGM